MCLPTETRREGLRPMSAVYRTCELLIGVVGVTLRSSGRAVSALNHVLLSSPYFQVLDFDQKL